MQSVEKEIPTLEIVFVSFGASSQIVSGGKALSILNTRKEYVGLAIRLDTSNANQYLVVRGQRCLCLPISPCPTIVSSFW